MPNLIKRHSRRGELVPDGDQVEEGFLEEKCTELPADSDSDYDNDSDCADSEVSSVCSGMVLQSHAKREAQETSIEYERLPCISKK